MTMISLKPSIIFLISGLIGHKVFNCKKAKSDEFLIFFRASKIGPLVEPQEIINFLADLLPNKLAFGANLRANLYLEFLLSNIFLAVVASSVEKPYSSCS